MTGGVITEKQARQITGGRKPLVPVEYESACKALQACVDLDEAKYWSDKADALAAWAKIYRDDQAGLEARRLKLHAYRRMGQIAQEMRPLKKTISPSQGGRIGRPPGAYKLLREHGLKSDHAIYANRLARAPEKEFNREVQRGAGLLSAAGRFRGLGAPCRRINSEQWHWLSGDRNSVRLVTFRTLLRRRSATEVALGISPGEVEIARRTALDIIEWLDEFEQALPKPEKGMESTVE